VTQSDSPGPPAPVYTEPAVERLERHEHHGRNRVPPRWLDGAPVTSTLIALGIAVFLVQMAESARQGGIADFPSEQLLRLGASYPPATIGEHRWETLVTACFLHGSIAHITLNMLFLWQGGPQAERAVGSARMAPIYLASGVFGYLLSVAYALLTRSAGYSVGASGAICGIFAAALVAGWRREGWRGPLTQAMARWLGFLLVLGVLVDVAGGNVDTAAHVGGAIAGAVLASVWRTDRAGTAAGDAWSLGLCLAVVVAAIGALAWHDRADKFANMMLEDRSTFTMDATNEGRCKDAREGLAAVERLRSWAAPVTSLANHVEAVCGR
jgi:rhomboid protease GluP